MLKYECILRKKHYDFRPKGEKIEQLKKQVICPLSRRLMVEPVIADDGYTYDKKYILRRFEKNKPSSMISPITNERMMNKDLHIDIDKIKILRILQYVWKVDIVELSKPNKNYL